MAAAHPERSLGRWRSQGRQPGHDLRIDALREEVQTKRDQIDVAGALAVAQPKASQ